MTTTAKRLALVGAVLFFVCGRTHAREEAVQALSLPSLGVEVEPKADYGPDAPPAYYPLEEVNQTVFRGVRHGFVNTTTGNLAFGVLDLRLPGRMPIEFRRVYDSGITSYLPPPPPNQPNEPRWTFDLGPNWVLGYAAYIVATSNGLLQATPEGDVLWWTESGGTFTRQFDAPTRHMKLQRQSSTVIIETQLDGTTWTYTWTANASGAAYLLTEIKDRSNNTITLTYNQGYLSKIQNSDGAYIDVFRPIFDANYPTTIFPRTRVTKLTDSTGRIVLLDYDSSGRLTKVTDALAKDWTYGYGSNDKLTSAVNPLSETYLNASYDSQARISTYEANAGPWTFAYNGGGWTTATDGLGHAWTYTPSASGITTMVKEPTLGQHTLTLGTGNNPTGYSGPSGESATWTYDANHRPLTHRPAGSTATITYAYDATNGWVNTITSLTGGVTTFTRDTGGRVTEERDAYTNRTTATYAANGDRLTMRLPEGNVTSGYLWTFTYDGYGNVLTATDPTGRVFEMQYTAQGDLYKLRRPDHLDSGTGQVVKVDWTYNRDLLGRITSSVDPLNHAWTRTYDNAGRLTRIQGPAGTNLRYAYDARYRLTDIWNDAITPNVCLVHFAYAAAGNLSQRTLAAGGTYLYEYDTSNRLIKVTDPLNRMWLYDRNASGAVIKVTYPGGRYVTITRDTAGRITDRLFPGGRHETFTFDNAGQLLTANVDESPNHAYLTWTRDLLERPLTLRTQVGYDSAGPDHTLTYTYDANGNRATLLDGGGSGTGLTTTFVYDPLDRLTSTTGGTGGGWQAVYDAYTGFRTQVTAGTNVEDWAYDAAGRILHHHWSRPAFSDGGDFTYTLDAEGRALTQTDTPNSVTDEMIYRADGLLAQLIETKGGVVTTATSTYDDGGKVTQTSSASGADPAVVTILQYDAAGRVSYARRDQTSRFYTWDDLPSDQGTALKVWRSPNDTTERSLELEYGYDGRLRKMTGRHIEEQNATVFGSYLWSPLDAPVTMASTEQQDDGSARELVSTLDIGGYFEQESIAGGGGGFENPLATADGARRALAVSGRGPAPDAEAPLRVGWSEGLNRFGDPLAAPPVGTALGSTRAIARLVAEAETRPAVTIRTSGDAMLAARIDFADEWSGEGIAAREWRHTSGASALLPGEIASGGGGATPSPFDIPCHFAACTTPDDPNGVKVDVCSGTGPTHASPFWTGTEAVKSRDAQCAIYLRASNFMGADTCIYKYKYGRPVGNPDSYRYPDITGSGVSLANGDFVEEVTDFAVFDASGSLPFTRSYRSGVTTTGVLGRKWNHNWNESLDFGHDAKHGDSACGYVVRWIQPDGNAMDFFWEPDPYVQGGGTWRSPAEGFASIRTFVSGGATKYEIRMSDGTTRQFNDAGEILSLVRLSHGYYFDYSTVAGGHRLTSVWTGAASGGGGVYKENQRLLFEYYTSGADLGRLSRVRNVSSTLYVDFHYNACGELDSVTYPPATLGFLRDGSPVAGSSVPSTAYAYANANPSMCASSDGPGFHMLTAITKAQRNPLTQDVTPAAMVANVFGSSVAGSADYESNRVVRQCFGTNLSECTASSSRIDYDYATWTDQGEAWQGSPLVSSLLDRRDPAQTVEERHHYYEGVVRWISEDFSGADRRTRFEYNTQGQLTRVRHPDGSCSDSIWDSRGGSYRIRESREKTPASCAGTSGAPPDRVTEYSYEWMSGQVATVTGPEAFPDGIVPSNFDPASDTFRKFTKFYYYDLNQTAANGTYPGDLGTQCSTWSLPCPAKLGDLNGDGGDDLDWSGALVKGVASPVAANGTYGTSLVSTQVVSPEGRPIKRTRSDLVQTVFTYYDGGPGAWDWRSGATQSSGGSGPLATSSVKAVSGSFADLVTRYGYNNRAERVVTQDAAGVRTEATLNGAGLPTEQRVCAPGPALSTDCAITGSDVTVHKTLGYSRFTYDLLGHQLRLASHDPTMAASESNPIAATWTTYDALGRPRSVTVDPDATVTPGEPKSGGGSALHLISRTCYDGYGRVKRTISPEGRVACVEYDALGRPTTATQYGALNADGARCDDDASLPNHFIGEGACLAAGASDARTESTYDIADRPFGAKDPAGHTTYVWYDAYGRPEYAADGKPSGALTPSFAGTSPAMPGTAKWFSQTSYDAAGRVGRSRFMGRNGRVADTIACGGATPPEGCGWLSVGWSAYDNLGRPTSSSAPVYPGDFVPSSVADATTPPADGTAGTRIATMQTAYRTDGRIDSQTDASGRVTTLAYDGFMRANKTLLPIVDGNQDFVQKEFDDAGRVNKVTRRSFVVPSPGQAAVQFDEAATTDYDAWGRVIRTTGAPTNAAASPEDLITTVEYDALSRPTRTVRRWVNATTYSGLDPNDRVTDTVYDRAGRVTDVKQRVFSGPDVWATTHYDFDRDSLMTDLTDPKAQKTTWVYSGGLGRVSKMLYPSEGGARQAVEVSSYDANGNPTAIRLKKSDTSSVAVAWTQTYDAFDRVTSKDAAFENFGSGDPTFYGTTHQEFAYDDLGRLVLALDRAPAFGASDQDIVVANAYDTAGRLLQEDQQLPVNGVLTHHRVDSAFDVDGFRTTLSFPESLNASGQALPRYVLSMAQDAMGRLASITGPQGPAEPAVGGSRGSRSLLTYSYLGDKVWKRWSGNGLETRFFEDGATPQPLYDALGRLRGMRSVDAGNGNPTIADVRYGYDRVGNRTYEQRRHEALTGGASGFRTRTYKSDLLGRLTKWREGGLGADSMAAPAVAPTVADPTAVIANPSDGEDWSLDMLGNWENHSVGASPAASDSYTANALNQYTQIDPAGGAPAKPLTFDWIGQLIQDDLKNRKYQWDAFGRLTRVITPGVSPAPDTIVATYRYDAVNRRVEKAVPTAPDATTRYLYDGWRAIEERAVLGSPGSQSEVVRARYGFGLGLDEVVWMDRDLNTDDLTVVDSRFFVAQDALGSAVAATADRTDFAQPLVVAERYTYSAYGKVSIWGGAWSSATGTYGTPRGQTSLIGLPYLYTGQRFDTESGLYYFKNRIYDGETGRFLRRDLIGLSGGRNLYSFAGLRPNSKGDPLGLFELDAHEFITKQTGALIGIPQDVISEILVGVLAADNEDEFTVWWPIAVTPADCGAGWSFDFLPPDNAHYHQLGQGHPETWEEHEASLAEDLSSKRRGVAMHGDHDGGMGFGPHGPYFDPKYLKVGHFKDSLAASFLGGTGPDGPTPLKLGMAFLLSIDHYAVFMRTHGYPNYQIPEFQYVGNFKGVDFGVAYEVVEATQGTIAEWHQALEELEAAAKSKDPDAQAKYGGPAAIDTALKSIAADLRDMSRMARRATGAWAETTSTDWLDPGTARSLQGTMNFGSSMEVFVGGVRQASVLGSGGGTKDKRMN